MPIKYMLLLGLILSPLSLIFLLRGRQRNFIRSISYSRGSKGRIFFGDSIPRCVFVRNSWVHFLHLGGGNVSGLG